MQNTEPRSTETRRKARAGLVAIRIGPRVYWVPTETARRIERIATQTATSDPEHLDRNPKPWPVQLLDYPE
jgi:hypothetical protein